MKRNPAPLHRTLWAEFETVAAIPATGWGDRYRKAFALAVLAAPLLALGGAPPAPQPSLDDAPANPTVDALKQVLALKPLDPKLEKKLRSARLRPSRDGSALLIDWG